MSACYWFGCRNSSFMSKRRSHVTSLAANVRAIYLVLVNNSAIIDGFFEHQLTGPSFSIKIKPEVNFWLSLSLTQVESEYSSTRGLSWLLYVIPQSLKPFR